MRTWCEYCGGKTERDKYGHCVACGAPEPRETAWDIDYPVRNYDNGVQQVMQYTNLCTTAAMSFSTAAGWLGIDD